ncbi:matrix metalloproteinase-19-like [Aedes albopictus]|uniref:Peptidase metallopeptidase domain-containing protein n=1 Tax=Aedes albopictus TaxID=7160 RepID=A0ABM1YHC9_AEDAL|nr:matrix metalloproteinase-19-like [Aedes albopictus]
MIQCVVGRPVLVAAFAFFVCIHGAAIPGERPYNDDPYFPTDLDGTNTTRDLTVVQKWSKSLLTYAIVNYPAGMPQGIVRSTIRSAFDSWSRVTNLDFVERASSAEVDIQLSFEGMNHYRRGIPCHYNHENTLAHAFFPELGDVHFNTLHFFNGETTREEFLNTAVHEIGHSLGLLHSASRSSIMYGAQVSSNLVLEPQPEDVEAIQAIYGVRSALPTTTNPPPTTARTRPTPRTTKPRTKTNLCSLSSFDTILVDHRGNICVLAGQYYYNLNETNPPPRKLSAKWPGLPRNVQAAVTYRDQKTYFYKDDQYWKYNKLTLEEGYPRPIEKYFPGIPTDGLDAILTEKSGGFLAFKGAQYWFYDTSKTKPVEWYYPKAITGDFVGLPARVDAALMTNAGRRFVFSKMRYYELDDRNRVVLRDGDVRKYWFNC